MTEPVSLVGVKEALKTLNSLDKSIRMKITHEYKELVQPLMQDAKALVPTKAPLSGFDRSWTPQGSGYQVLPFSATKQPRPPGRPGEGWQQSRAGRRQMANWLAWNAQMRAYMSGKTPRMSNGYMKNVATFGVKWQGPASVLFDTSAKPHTPQGARMISALNGRFGGPSRVMWRAYRHAGPDVQKKVADLCSRIIDEANKAMTRRARLRRAMDN